LLKRKRPPSKYAKKFRRKKGLTWHFPQLELKPVLILIVAAIAILLAGGGIYFLFSPSFPAISLQGRVYPLVPQRLSIQTLSESLLAILFLSAGVGGCYLSWSGLQARIGHRPSMVKTVVGMALLASAITATYMLAILKLG